MQESTAVGEDNGLLIMNKFELVYWYFNTIILNAVHWVNYNKNLYLYEICREEK